MLLFQFDFASTTWGMEPAQIIEMLQSSTKNVSEPKETKVLKKDDEIVSRLKSPK